MTQGQGTETTQLWNSRTCPRRVGEKKKQSDARQSRSSQQLKSFRSLQRSCRWISQVNFFFFQFPTGDEYGGYLQTDVAARCLSIYQRGAPCLLPTQVNLTSRLIIESQVVVSAVHLSTCPHIYPSLHQPQNLNTATRLIDKVQIRHTSVISKVIYDCLKQSAEEEKKKFSCPVLSHEASKKRRCHSQYIRHIESKHHQPPPLSSILDCQTSIAAREGDPTTTGIGLVMAMAYNPNIFIFYNRLHLAYAALNPTNSMLSTNLLRHVLR